MLNPIIIFFLVNSLVYVEVDIVQGYSFGKNQVARNEKMHKPTGFPYTLTGLENFKHFLELGTLSLIYKQPSISNFFETSQP